MAGNGYENGQGAVDPRKGWSAVPGGAQGGGGQGGSGQAGQPEYFTAPHEGYRAQPQETASYGSAAAYGSAGSAGSQGSADSHGSADQPGHTRAFTVGVDPYAESYADPYGQQTYPVQDNVAVYRAGGQSAPHVTGPRLSWKALLVGIYREPSRTFDRMRDHQLWLPALTVSLLYGVLAVLGIGMTHNDVVNSTFSVAAWALLGAAVAFTLAGAMLGAVTYGLARQLGGDGPWQSTVGLAALIGWTTDAPRLLFALFLPADNVVVQVLGWVTWLLCAALLTTMVRRVHDLPWGKAAGAAALQLLALLVLIKLPTLG